jgi:lysine 6-dehydrogenase
MGKKVIILGCGRVGSAMAIDMGKSYEVTVVDSSGENLLQCASENYITTFCKDISRITDWNTFLSDFDLVISAVPGYLGYETLKKVIESGKDVVDITFFPEDPFELDEIAKTNGVTAVVDCGVAPGMGNMILGHHNAVMDVHKYVCYVGGLPFEREWPWEYKAVFSPIDVIEEYVRPARYIQNGEMVIREALSDPELIEFDEIGALEAWNSDGLRTLIKTIDVPDMIEKTMRYPGTIEYLKVLRDTGFFSYDEIEIKGYKIRPIDVTTKLLFPKWQLKKGEEDFIVMRIKIEGVERKEKVTFSYDLFDRYDRKTDTLSMARTTGYTATAVADLMLGEQFQRPGICPPEYVGAEPGKLDAVLEYLKNRGVIYRISKF